MVVSLLQEFSSGVPGILELRHVVVKMMMVVKTNQPRKIGRKEMAVGTIQAKAIIRQATLTVNNCDDDHGYHDDRDDEDLSHVDDTGNNDDGGQTDYNADDDDYVYRNAV